MKSSHLALYFIVVSILLCSCKHEEKMIKEVAYNYSYAMANYKVDDAAKYATEETVNTTLVKAKTLVEAVGEKYVKSDTPANIDITDLKILSDTVAVVDYHKTTPIKDFTGKLELRKRNGKWFAHIPLKEVKQAPMPESTKDIRTFEPPTPMKKNKE